MHCGSATCPSEDEHSVRAATAVAACVKKEVCFTLVMPISPIPIMSHPVSNHDTALETASVCVDYFKTDKAQAYQYVLLLLPADERV